MRLTIRTATLLATVAIILGPNLIAAAAEPASQRDVPQYRIYPLPNGVCKIAGNHALHGGDNAETYDFGLYVWLILGGEKPILVDAGLTDLEEMNRGAAHVLREPVTQAPHQQSRRQLRRFGLTPDDIGHVLVTHLHFDHVDDLMNYRNAQIVMGKNEWTVASTSAPSWAHPRVLHEFLNNPQCKRRLVLVEDEEVLPGIESFWVGGHTVGSMAYRINTAHGRVVLTGDTVSLAANIERDIPPGVFTDLDECRAAMKRIRAAVDGDLSRVLPSHDPIVSRRWPPIPRGSRKYTIRAIKVGECEVRDYITFQDSEEQTTTTYNLYVWAILGGPKPILVETGPKYPAEFSKSTAKYIPGGIKQLPEERTPAALRRHGIDPAEVSHVIVTHLHADHYDYFDAFANARLVVNRREYEAAKDHLAPDVRRALAERPDALQLVEEAQIAPGIRVVPLGGHTDGSQGVLVQTHLGPAILTGDTVYKYANIEENRPIRSASPEACHAAMSKIRRLADIVLPAHDPETLERWPGGVIGGVERRGTPISRSESLGKTAD